MHPTKPESIATYGMAGLPSDPNELQKLGGQKVLERLINFVAKAPAGSKERQLNLDAIYNAFSRQESVRQFVNLIANGGVPALHQFRDSLKEAAKQNYAEQAAKKRLQYSSLVRASQAMTNLGIGLVSGADWPLEHLYARPVIAASNFVVKHPHLTTGLVDAGLGLGAANALRRVGAFSKMGRFGKIGSFLSGASAIERGLIGQAITKEELPAAIGGGAAEGTRANPFWVIISPLSWAIGGPSGFGDPIPKDGGSWLSKIWKSTAGKIGFGSILGGAARAAPGILRTIGLKGLGRIAAPIGLGLAVHEYGWKQVFDPFASAGGDLTGGSDRTKFNFRGKTYQYGTGTAYNALLHAGLIRKGQNVTPDLVHHLMQGGRGMSPERAAMLFSKMSLGSRGNPVHVEGNAHITVDITALDSAGRKRTLKRGVDMPIGARSFPTTKGQPGSRRGRH